MRICVIAVLILMGFKAHAQESDWMKAKKKGKAEIIVYWHISEPFVSPTNSEKPTGIEPDIFDGFEEFLKNRHSVDLSVKWVEMESFQSMTEYMKDQAVNGEFAVAAYSITKEREKYLTFSQPYMNDAAVMISHSSIPVMTSVEQFNEVLSTATAITVEGTTYEDKLKSLQSELNIDINISYMPSTDPVIDNISSNENSIGYVDLPLYLMALKNDPTIPVLRQNLYPIKSKGYGIAMPLNSDWKPVLDEYISSLYFKEIRDQFINYYLDKDVYEIITSVTGDNAVNTDELIILLNKEKEIQNKQLINSAIETERGKWIQYLLIGMLLMLLVAVFIVYRLYSAKTEALKDSEKSRDLISHQQARIEKANSELLEMDHEKNNLIRVLAHDLRSPINHVAGLAEVLLLSEKNLTDESKEIINQIIKASGRLRDMIGKILDAEAVNTLTPKINFEKVSIAKIFNSLEEEYSPTANSKHINLSLSKVNGLYVYADSVFFEQILDNLVSNALKFSNANSTISVRATDKDDNVLIEVEDEGPGFTLEDEERMFQKFQRLSAQPTAGEHSTGLGLNIVKMYTELMHGSLTYRTRPGKGTTFRLTFPKEEVHKP